MAALKFLFAVAFVALAWLHSGCATARPTYRLRDGAATHVPAPPQIVIANVDAELAELTAGGLLELRDEWTSAAVKNLADALAAETGYRPTPIDASRALRTEQADVQALLRAITLNHLSLLVPGRAPPFPAQGGDALTYNTGALPQHADALQAHAVLFVFIRDSYATTGRKSLLALSFIGAALTGVAVVPAMGSTVMSAALVNRDGTVLWFNHSLGGHDPRTPDGARALVRELLAGLPRAAAGT